MRAQVIVIAGPSGSGKSRLCRRLQVDLGLPLVQLDDFYRDGTEAGLPRGPGGRVDWDDPRSWSCDEAVAALTTLCSAGSVEVPVYQIASDARVGRRRVALDGAAYVLAEGIFADQVVGALRAEGLLANALCVHNPRVLTFWRRLVRDLREARKPPWVVVRRGLALLRADPLVVARAEAAGCVVVRSAAAYERVRRLTS